MNAALIVLVIVGLWAFSKVSAAQQISIRIADFPQGIHSENGAIKFLLPFTIVNPNREFIRINALNLKVYLNGVEIGQAYLLQGVELKDVDTVIYPEIALAYDGLTVAIPEIKSVSKKVQLRFVGTVRTFGFTVPLDDLVTIQFPKILF